jgi:hypothetical protein
MDVPYFGMVNGAYSDSPDDLANMTIEAWEVSITEIATSCAVAQSSGCLCTVVSPNYRDTARPQEPPVLAPRIIQRAFEQARTLSLSYLTTS